MDEAFDSKEFRRILGHYPTGVCAITARGPAGPVGMIVGSFTSVSLDPPLVAFLPARDSRTWPAIEADGQFCVNVLGEDQRDVCRALSARGPDKFADIAWRPTATGLAMIDGAVAWIDCRLNAIHTAGDHFIAIGRVRALGTQRAGPPLLFLRGDYGGVAPCPAAYAA